MFQLVSVVNPTPVISGGSSTPISIDLNGQGGGISFYETVTFGAKMKLGFQSCSMFNTIAEGIEIGYPSDTILSLFGGYIYPDIISNNFLDVISPNASTNINFHETTFAANDKTGLSLIGGNGKVHSTVQIDGIKVTNTASILLLRSTLTNDFGIIPTKVILKNSTFNSTLNKTLPSNFSLHVENVRVSGLQEPDNLKYGDIFYTEISKSKTSIGKYIDNNTEVFRGLVAEYERVVISAFTTTYAMSTPIKEGIGTIYVKGEANNSTAMCIYDFYKQSQSATPTFTLRTNVDGVGFFSGNHINITFPAGEDYLKLSLTGGTNLHNLLVGIIYM